MNIDMIGASVMALFTALGVCGFVFGVFSFTTIEKLSKRIERLEDKVRRLM